MTMLKKVALVACFSCMSSLLYLPKCQAGPIRNLIAHVIHRPKPPQPQPAQQVTTTANLAGTYAILAPMYPTCTSCQGNPGNGIIWATK